MLKSLWGAFVDGFIDNEKKGAFSLRLLTQSKTREQKPCTGHIKQQPPFEENMQGYLSRTLYVSRSEQFSENEAHGKLSCGLWETVWTIVFIIVYIILQILFEAHARSFKN